MIRRLIILALILLPCIASAHSWYPIRCCHDQDCQPVKCEDISEVPDGFMYDGVKFERSAEQPSQDRHCHVCIMNMDGKRRGLCLFTLQGT